MLLVPAALAADNSVLDTAAELACNADILDIADTAADPVCNADILNIAGLADTDDIQEE